MLEGLQSEADPAETCVQEKPEPSKLSSSQLLKPLLFSSWLRTLLCFSALRSDMSSAMTGTSSPWLVSPLSPSSLSDSVHRRASFSYVGK